MELINSHVRLLFYDNFTCENYRFSNNINHSFCMIFYIGRKDSSLYNKQKIHGCMEIPDLFHVLNMIFHTHFVALTREIPCSTLDIDLLFPCIILY